MCDTNSDDADDGGGGTRISGVVRVDRFIEYSLFARRCAAGGK